MAEPTFTAEQVERAATVCLLGVPRHHTLATEIRLQLENGVKWTGPECSMCHGTGIHPYRPPAGTVWARCAACNGHGRDALADFRGINDNVRSIAALTRRPYGGDNPSWQQAVIDVVDAARAAGILPATALIDTFGIERPTAYAWLRDITDG